MKKIIQITEKDIQNVVKKVIAEQTVPPFPDKKDIGERRPMGGTGEPSMPEKPEFTTPSPILMAKREAFQNLTSSVSSIKKLMALSGVNLEAIVSDIEKAMVKFDSLYGMPKPKEKK